MLKRSNENATTSFAVPGISRDRVVLNARRPGAPGGPAVIATMNVEAAAAARVANAGARAPIEAATEASDHVTLNADFSSSLTEDAAGAADDVGFGHLAMRAALDSHRTHYGELRSSVPVAKMRPRPVPAMQPLAAARAARKMAAEKPVYARDVVVGMAAKTRRKFTEELHAGVPGLNHIRAAERHVVSVAQSAKPPAGATGRRKEDDEVAKDPAGPQLTMGVGAKAKSAQQAWAASWQGEMRHAEIIATVAAHSANLYARTMEEISK